MKLLCIPYAGGSSTIYHSWKKLIHSSITIVPLELAGRGGRIGHSFYNSIAGDGTDDLFLCVKEHLDGSPIAIFGHSMGTLFTFELAHRIHRETGQFPIHLFFSGRGAPHLPLKGNPIHELSDAAFQAEVLQLGGTPKEVFEHKELSDIYMPILRSDYRLVEMYEDHDETRMLNCDITILRGNQDRYSQAEAEAWKEYTNGASQLIEFDGGHFFINEFRQQVIDVIHRSLQLIHI